MIGAELGRVRLGNQLLTGTKPRGVGDVVRHMLALQAQDYRQALWAVGSRLGAGTVGDVEAALERAEIVRSWPMRGTIHLMAADDVRWLVGLCAPRVVAGDARRLAQLELTERDVARAEELVRGELTGRGPVSRSALTRALDAGGIATTGQRGYHLLWRLAQQRVICIGPTRQKEQTFALLDEWVPPAEELERDDALARLAGRFAAGRGPVTAHDLARWAGLTVTDARRGLQAADLTTHEVDGRQHWAPDVPAPGGAGNRNWHAPLLLAGFDEYLIGYRDRDALIDPAHAGRVVPGGNGIYRPMVVAGGRIVGTWQRSVTGRELVVQVAPFEDGALAASGLAAPARRYATFFRLPPPRVSTA